jgi:cytochrome bd-type quinol oxidase subunit 1
MFRKWPIFEGGRQLWRLDDLAYACESNTTSRTEWVGLAVMMFVYFMYNRSVQERTQPLVAF